MQERGIRLSNVVLVCGNAPCHSRLEQVVAEIPGVELLRLAPYSPMLNPIENIWSKVKASIKRNSRIPQVLPPEVMEQRLVYLGGLIRMALAEVTVGDCSRCIQHTSTFHSQALNMIDMPVGN